jgi:hypothetical protein
MFDVSLDQSMLRDKLFRLIKNHLETFFQIGKALCDKAKFSGFVSIKLTETNSRQKLGGDVLPSDEQQVFSQCLIIHLVCSK